MTRLGNRYRLQGVIGVGGTATVHRAYDELLGVERAVKLLHQDSGPEMVERLRAEARVLARIDHRNVLRVYDVGHEEGRDYIVMDLVEGKSLQERLDETGPLPPQEAGALMLQVLDALAAAHAAGVIHRDVKPHNVLVATDGRVLLADFGIARVFEGDRHTRTNVAMGSLAYMAPEQRLDAHAAAVTADIYAAACTLYATLTGASPMDLFAAPPNSPRWSDLTPPLRDLIQRATRHDPDARPQNLQVFIAELKAALLAVDDQQWVAPAAPMGVEARLRSAPTFVDGPSNIASAATVVSGPAAPTSRTRSPVSPLARWAVALAVLLGIGGLGWIAVGGFTEPAVEGTPVSQSEGGRPIWNLPPPPSADPIPPELPAEPTPARPVADGAATPVAVVPPVRPVGAPKGTTAARNSTVHAARTGASALSLSPGWTGAFAARSASLQMTGTDAAISGEWTVRFGENAVANKVRGSWVGGELTLEDVEDGPDAGTYRAHLAADGSLEGTFEARSGGRTVAFRMRAAGSP